MNVRDAILRAANQIEAHPETFNFMSCSTPRPDCGTPGCALGWIGFFAGHNHMARVSRDILRLPREKPDSTPDYEYDGHDFAFYNRMSRICGTAYWQIDPALCANALRQYADKYHPATAKIYAFPKAA